MDKMYLTKTRINLRKMAWLIWLQTVAQHDRSQKIRKIAHNSDQTRMVDTLSMSLLALQLEKR